jgi:hypothetical protein
MPLPFQFQDKIRYNGRTTRQTPMTACRYYNEHGRHEWSFLKWAPHEIARLTCVHCEVTCRVPKAQLQEAVA